MATRGRCGICREVGHNRRKCPNMNLTQVVNETVKCLIDHNSPSIIRARKIFRDMLSQPNAIENRRDNLKSQLEKKIDEKIQKYLQQNETSLSFTDVKNMVRMYDPKYNDCQLWYRESEYLCANIQEQLINNPSINNLLVTAECGSGKSAYMNCYMYSDACLTSYDNPFEYRPIEHKYILTGYSSSDYCNDMKGNIDFTNKVYHLNTIDKLIEHILEDPTRLCNADFIVDEGRLVVKTNQTIHNLFVKLGIDNPDMIKLYNIRVIYIDATLDSLLLVNETLCDKNTSMIFLMEPGETYKGVNYFNDSDNDNIVMNDIIDDTNIHKPSGLRNIVSDIQNICVSEKRNVVMRVKDDKMRNQLTQLLIPHGIRVCIFMADMKNWPTDLSTDFNESINKKYQTNGIVFILSHKYTCSKRLTLGENIGMIYDSKNAKNPDEAYDTNTTQGLIPRFFGYYDMSSVNVKIYCNIVHFENQLYTLRTGMLPPAYKSGVVKNNKLKHTTYTQELTGTKDVNARLELNDFIRRGVCFQGSYFKAEMERLYPDIHDRFYANMYNGEILENGELFHTEDDAQRRVVYIRGSEYTFHSNTVWKFSRANNAKNGSLNYGEAEIGRQHQCRLIRVKHDPDDVNEPVKYILKWMRRFPPPSP